jgi:hypothetical protein
MKGSGPACSKGKRPCSPPVVEKEEPTPKRVRFSSETKSTSQTDTNETKSPMRKHIQNREKDKVVRAYNRRTFPDEEKREKEQGIEDFIKNFDRTKRQKFSGGARTRRKRPASARNRKRTTIAYEILFSFVDARHRRATRQTPYFLNRQNTNVFYVL